MQDEVIHTLQNNEIKRVKSNVNDESAMVYKADLQRIFLSFAINNTSSNYNSSMDSVLRFPLFNINRK